MSNYRFILISAIIFAVRYFCSVFWPFLLQADLFIIWALTVFFLERNSHVNIGIFLGTAIFFDFWSGSSFGMMTLALVLTMLIIFIIKKIILLERRSSIFSLTWLIIFYHLTIFIQNGFSLQFSPPAFIITILWIILIMIINSFNVKNEKVSSIRL